MEMINDENILEKICYINDNEFYINYPHFKLFANTDTFNIITEHIINNISKILKTCESFIFHFDVKGISLKDIDKYYNYCVYLSIIMKEKFPDKLQKCYVYNSTELFKILYSGFSIFIDKKTRNKFQFIDTGIC